MTREVAHQKSFEKALYAIEPNFPPGKTPGRPEFTDKYYNMSIGEGDMRGPWNEGPQWEFVDGGNGMRNVDGGDGMAHVKVTEMEKTLAEQNMVRSKSNPGVDPTTGADLGAGPGGGAMTGQRASNGGNASNGGTTGSSSTSGSI